MWLDSLITRKKHETQENEEKEDRVEEEAEGCWAASAGCRKEIAKETLGHLVGFGVGD